MSGGEMVILSHEAENGYQSLVDKAGYELELETL
jgi:hypothetical protein